MAKILRFRTRKKATPEQGRLFDDFAYTPAADLRLGIPADSDARSVPFPSDAGPTDPLDRPEAATPEGVRRETFRRRGRTLLLAAVFMGGTLVALFGDRGWLDVQRSRQALAESRDRFAEQQERVLALRREVERLRDDPAAIERIAREELGFARPGEVTLLLPEEGGLDRAGGFARIPPTQKPE